MKTLGSFALAISCALAFAGCDPEPAPSTQRCSDIIDACHDVDPGVGEEHDCHQTAHDVGTAEACDPIADRCVMLCNALEPTDGGGHHHGDDGGAHEHDAGHEHDHDGGAHEHDAGEAHDHDGGEAHDHDAG